MTALLVLIFISAGIFLTGILFKLSYCVQEKIQLQIATDLALRSALNTESNFLNSLAIGNRAVLAHEAMTAQANALVSESIFSRKLIDGFSSILKLLPGYGPILAGALAKGGHFVEIALKKISAVLIPAACTLNRILAHERNLMLKELPLAAIKSARDSLKISDPEARIIHPVQIQIIGRIGNLTNRIRYASSEQTQMLVRKTMDAHTINRSWRFGTGILSLPFRKTGGSRVETADHKAFDILKVRRFSLFGKKWKTAISAESSATDFKYRNTSKIFILKDSEIPLTHTLITRKKLPSFLGDKNNKLPTLTAASSGTVYFNRPGKPDEKANLLNPFWHSRLIPVREESSAKKFIPKFILAEVRH